jgi:hypothetical protein
MSREQYEVFARTTAGVECRVVARPLPRLGLVATPRRWWNTLRWSSGWEVFVERADLGHSSQREVLPNREEAISRADAVASSLTEVP